MQIQVGSADNNNGLSARRSRFLDTNKFKQCPKCHTWLSARTIIESSDINPIGMTIVDDEPELNFYYFNHDCSNCHTTFTVLASDFEPYITEPIPTGILTGQLSCELHCTNIEDLNACSQECRWAPYRRFLLRMIAIKEKARQKQPT